jgi:hypothetical protein
MLLEKRNDSRIIQLFEASLIRWSTAWWALASTGDAPLADPTVGRWTWKLNGLTTYDRDGDIPSHSHDNILAWCCLSLAARIAVGVH